MCGGLPFQAHIQQPSITAGDSMAVNLAAQGSTQRLFISAVPETYALAPPINGANVAVDAARSVRPFVATTTDGVPVYRAKEVADSDWGIRSAPNMRLALEIDKTTCKRGRAVGGTGTTGTIPIPALDQDDGSDCVDVVMGFATAHLGDIRKSGTIPGGGTASYNFNTRCAGTTSSPSEGACSITGDRCDVANPTECAAVPGQVCVPSCAPLGAIFRANPVVNGPPDALLRDSGYRAFQAARAKRKPALFAATTDGVLHAFKAMETASGAHHELWSFIPPAVLPRLASNYPAGNQILLDGTPVVRDTVWDRSVGDLDAASGTSPGAKWHTTLVAGLGAGGGGYYAVNVTDSDCSPTNVTTPSTATQNECRERTGANGYEEPAQFSLDEAGAGEYQGSGSRARRGPHFLWQLTDVQKGTVNDPAHVVRRTRDGQDMVSLFGRNTGTPAITTLQVRVSGVDRQLGVAILPGGVDGSPVAGQSCPRTIASSDVAVDTATGYRSAVRKWAQNCSTGPTSTTANSAVPGRGITIVRLDNGQILRHFGRRDDVPETIWNAGVVTATAFDSPMVGTPVVYPQTVGAVAQKIFVGDADGTLWRIDVTDLDPANWKVNLFADLIPSAEGAAGSQPIQTTPVISLDPSGAIVINAATGDQENVIYRANEKNYVWSILEVRPTSPTTPPRARTNWREVLDNGERVTGPMTVFDRTLYFATFAPHVPAHGQCENAGVARLWGLNYLHADGSGANPGGLPMWCPNVTANGVCSGTVTKNEDVTGALAGFMIPGVTLRPTQACSNIDNLGDGTGSTGFESLTPSEFQLSYGIGKANSPKQGMPPSAMTNSSKRPLPRIATTVNAWALVVD
jgi:type IV pilus assembly protein PilY1